MTEEIGTSRNVQHHYYSGLWPVGRLGGLFCGASLVVIGAVCLSTNLKLILRRMVGNRYSRATHRMGCRYRVRLSAGRGSLTCPRTASLLQCVVWLPSERTIPIGSIGRAGVASRSISVNWKAG